MEKKILSVINDMSDVLSAVQLRTLRTSLLKHFADNVPERTDVSNEEYARLFLEAKEVEGCSERTIAYYKSTIVHFLSQIEEPVRRVNTETIRTYLVEYQKIKS